jgi:hypothetical protein
MDCPDDNKRRLHITQHGGLGLAWFAGWLFTIGYLHQGFWQGLLGVFVWPYFLGAHLAALPAG